MGYKTPLTIKALGSSYISYKGRSTPFVLFCSRFSRFEFATLKKQNRLQTLFKMSCWLVKMGCLLVKLIVQCLCMWNKIVLPISSLFLPFLSQFLWTMDPPRSSFNQLSQVPLDQSWQSWALIEGKWWPHLWVTQWDPNKTCRGGVKPK